MDNKNNFLVKPSSATPAIFQMDSPSFPADLR